MRFLLDTNVCIDFARGRSPSLLVRMKKHLRDGLGMSAISYAELMVGARGPGDDADRGRLHTLARIVRIMPFEDGAGMAYGKLVRAIVVKRHAFDRLIAAHAVALGVTLVTNNESDFVGIPGLQIENWTL